MSKLLDFFFKLRNLNFIYRQFFFESLYTKIILLLFLLKILNFKTKLLNLIIFCF